MRTNLILGIVLLVIIGGIAWMFRDTLRGKTPSEPEQTNADMLTGSTVSTAQAMDVQYSDGTTGYYAYPEARGNYPGVVMIHEWWGLNDHIKDMARELAGNGYHVLAVDLYRGEVAQDATQARTLVSSIKQDEATKNLRDATAFLRDKGAYKIASLGWCFGGGQSLNLALSGEPLDATVIYYGNLVTDKAMLSKITWPVLGVFGDQDQSIPVATVQAFDKALDETGIENEIHIYPGVGHAFANPSGANYAPEPTQDAWEKTLAFLHRTIKYPSNSPSQ